MMIGIHIKPDEDPALRIQSVTPPFILGFTAHEHHQMRSLPPLLFECSALTSLDVTCTAILEIPDAIGQLVSLRMFYAADCGITHVSASLGKCARLRELDLSENYFATLPPTLVALRKLRILQFNNNPNYRGNNSNTYSRGETQTSLAYIAKRFAYGNGARDACLTFLLCYRSIAPALPRDVALWCIVRRWLWASRDDDEVWYEANVAARDRRAYVRYVPTYI